MAEQERKKTQRERLLEAMVAVTNRHGYGGASVAAVIAEARVSRATFYEQFADREDALIAAIEGVDDALNDRVSNALAAAGPSAAWGPVLGALISLAREDRAGARFLTGESMGGGPAALDARDHSVVRLAKRIGESSATSSEALPAIEARAAIGGVYRMIAARLRRGEPVAADLEQDLRRWVARYAEREAERRAREASLARSPGLAPEVRELPIERMPSGLGAGRPWLPPEDVAANQRLRLLYATAKLAAEKGYAATTVVQITKLARVRADTFYGQFADKQEVFLAVHEYGFQQVMDVTVKAYFSVEGWPQRSWAASRTLIELLEANPLVAHASFVAGYAAGPRAVQRIEDTHTAFLFFLQEGIALCEDPPTRVEMEAVIAATFELIYLRARRDGETPDSRLAQIPWIWLAPFMGAAAAERFIEGQAKGGRRHGREAKKRR